MQNQKYNLMRFHIMAISLVRLAMIVGISCAAIHFGRVSVLWFYLIPGILMHDNYHISEDDNNENK